MNSPPTRLPGPAAFTLVELLVVMAIVAILAGLFAGLSVSHDRADLTHDPADAVRSDPRANTTIAVVATNARLGKADAQRLAIMAQDGLARAIQIGRAHV